MQRRPGWNLTRRNRNIGTAARGHGQDNQLVIPSRWETPIYWENLGEYTRETRLIHGRNTHFVVELCVEGYSHACSIDDVASVLEFVPNSDLQGLQLFVFRQPKRKKKSFAATGADWPMTPPLGVHSTGPLPGLSGIPRSSQTPHRFWLNASLGALGSAELERLRADGHTIARRGSRYRIECSMESVRNTQRHRTVLREIGHWVDYLEKVERPGNDCTRYFERSSGEKERYAHAYADKLGAELRATGRLPLPCGMAATSK